MRAVALRLGVVVAGVGLALPGSATAAPGVSHDRKAAGAASLARFWTPERLREADPRPLRAATRARTRQLMRTRPRGRSGARAANVLRRYAGDGGGIDHHGTYEVAHARTYPNVVTGKVFARDARGAYTCSATVVNSRSNNILFTAAHCVRTPGGGWARKFIFIPAFRHGAAPFGKWEWKTFYLPRGWSRLKHDYAAVKLSKRNGRKVEARVGAAGFAWGQGYRHEYRALGYPSNFFGGGRMIGCLSPTTAIDSSFGRPAPIGIDCRMGSGSSGGGWLIHGDGHLNSVMSYSYRARRGVAFGPYLNNRAIKLLRWAERD